MEVLKIFILAVVQGLTEFLPISSSGHLVLLQNLFGMHEPELLLDICLHVGTLLSVLVVFMVVIFTAFFIFVTGVASRRRRGRRSAVPRRARAVP